MGDLISREYLQDKFDNYCPHIECKKCRWYSMKDSFHKCALIDNAPTVAPDLAQVLAYESGKVSARPQGEWIPVSERLPNNSWTSCLVTVYETNSYTQEDYKTVLPYSVGYDGETWNDIDGNVIPYEVIAWQPLPKPYREEAGS